jgi:ribosome-associated translation inhibitor RaiA
MMAMEIRSEHIPREQVDAARAEFAKLEHYVDHPPEGARLTLRQGGGSFPERDFVADASVLFNGRVLAAHTAGPTPAEATEEAVERLRRQLRRVVRSDVASRNEPEVIAKALDDIAPDRRHRPPAQIKDPDERSIVQGHTYADLPVGTLSAVADLVDLDLEFLLFRHVRTEEDVVVYRRDDGRIGLIHPRDSVLADENDIVAPEPNRYAGPLTVDDARNEMDILNHRFVYFIDAADNRGKVIYLRHDGDYGLVEPE